MNFYTAWCFTFEQDSSITTLSSVDVCFLHTFYSNTIYSNAMLRQLKRSWEPSRKKIFWGQAILSLKQRLLTDNVNNYAEFCTPMMKQLINCISIIIIQNSHLIAPWTLSFAPLSISLSTISSAFALDYSSALLLAHSSSLWQLFWQLFCQLHQLHWLHHRLFVLKRLGKSLKSPAKSIGAPGLRLLPVH